MDTLNNIFKKWEDARTKRQNSFSLKNNVELEYGDSYYKICVKELILKRIDFRLSIDEVAEVLGISRQSLNAFETFRSKENIFYVYTLRYLFGQYRNHLEIIKEGNGE